MKRMYSEEQLDLFVKDVLDENVVGAIAGKDIAPKDISASGNLVVSGSINGESNPSVKPIYYHGLNMFNNTNKTSFQMHILKNDNNAIDTMQKLIEWASSISGSVFLAGSGCIKVDSSWYSMFGIEKSGSGDNISFRIYYVDPSNGVSSIANVNLSTTFTNIVDASNKIN